MSQPNTKHSQNHSQKPSRLVADPDRPKKYPFRLQKARETSDAYLDTYFGRTPALDAESGSLRNASDIRARMGKPVIRWTKEKWPGERPEEE